MLRRKIKQRAKPEKFLKGTQEDFDRLIERVKHFRYSFEIFIIQPGLTKRGMAPHLAKILASVSDYVAGSGYKPLNYAGPRARDSR
jgi:cell division GTPase FtsZ